MDGTPLLPLPSPLRQATPVYRDPRPAIKLNAPIDAKVDAIQQHPGQQTGSPVRHYSALNIPIRNAHRPTRFPHTTPFHMHADRPCPIHLSPRARARAGAALQRRLWSEIGAIQCHADGITSQAMDLLQEGDRFCPSVACPMGQDPARSRSCTAREDD